MTVKEYVELHDKGMQPNFELVDKQELELIPVMGTIRPAHGKFIVSLRKKLSNGLYRVEEQFIVKTHELAEIALGLRGYFPTKTINIDTLRSDNALLAYKK